MTRHKHQRRSYTGTCGGKIRFRTLAEAKRVISNARVKSATDRFPTRAYECDSCHGWHLTSQSEGRRAA